MLRLGHAVARARRRRRAGLLVVLHLAALLALTAGAARADSLDDRQHRVEHELADAKDRVEAARGRERTLAGQVSVQSDRIDALESEIGGVGAELASLEGTLGRSRARVQELRRLLEEKTQLLALARRQLAVATQRMERRLVEIYTSEQPDVLEIVLGASDIETLIDGFETAERVAELDRRLAKQFRDLRGRLARERKRTAALRAREEAETELLARQMRERRTLYASLVSRRNAVASIRTSRKRALASVHVQREQWEAEADALEAESARIASILAASPPPSPEPAQPGPSGDGDASPVSPPTSSGFVWPVRGTVVSPYGQRWGRLHAGVDIAAPAGTPIVASAAGRVVYAGSMSGYGLIVVIQHAGGLATAYAHNSSISVSVGQSVAQGQTIAAVGCTGSCFGDHVHFEVRLNGSPVDPMGYL